MKKGSSRFFVILLHLLGVSNHHLPSWYYDYLTSTTSSDRTSFSSGIRGVHPHSIVLERLDLREVGGLDGVEWLGAKPETDTPASSAPKKPQHATDSDVAATQIAREPFWLQDTQDGQCLGPSGGFSECGDATLWFILRRGTERKSLRMGPFGVEEVLERQNPEEPYRYALQIVDEDSLLQTTAPPSPSPSSMSSLTFSWRQKRRLRKQRDCLVASSNSPRPNASSSPSSFLELGSCAKQRSAWSWRVDSRGFLYLPTDVSRTNGRECLRRTQSSSAILSSCQDDLDQEQQRLVQFSLVRYHATSSSPVLSSPPTSEKDQTKVRPTTPFETRASKAKSQQSIEKPKVREGLPSNRDIAHSHASEPVMHSPIFEMNLAGRPLLSNMPSQEARKEAKTQPFAALKDTNPILFLGTEGRHLSRNNKGPKKTPMLHSASMKKIPQVSSPPPGKLRKIEMNPYIAASQDEIWADPQTGLEYPTDLCRYLGHDRKGYGRHTLVGVGLFLKTMLKIKVYGIAYYVSKRDVLADPSFQQYAGLSAEELRNRPDFYEMLRKGGSFDQTLFLKTNMQLSTETMRSSLDSDWKMLSEEAKNLLIDTSMRPRPAEGKMLEQIQRADNPSRCSCAQTAPEEIKADPSCCARGIELAFTWRKNGDIEVRLNGRLMDSFPRPDIGNGIFFEYLRTDDPFSPDFTERLVDGFPFLLSPLAQVQGITLPEMQAPPQSAAAPANSFLKTVSGAAHVVSSQVVGLAGAVQHGASEAVAGAVHAAQTTGDAMRHFGEEAEKKRQSMFKDMIDIVHQHPTEVISDIAALAEEKRQAMWKDVVEMSHQNPAEVFSEFAAKILATGERQDEEPRPCEPEPQVVAESKHAPHGRFFHPATSRWFGETLDVPDEIGPMIHPTMNKTILSLVHLYLLLILIVSFPPTNSNTKFVVRRSCKMVSVSSSESSLVQRVQSGRDSLILQKGKLKSMCADQLVGRGNGKKIAPEPPSNDTTEVEMWPEDDADPVTDGNAPQRIHIDISLPGRLECKERKPSNGKKRVLSRARITPNTQSADGHEALSVRSNVSDDSGGRVRRKGRKKRESANDNLKKSLSYFL